MFWSLFGLFLVFLGNVFASFGLLSTSKRNGLPPKREPFWSFEGTCYC